MEDCSLLAFAGGFLSNGRSQMAKPSVRLRPRHRQHIVPPFHKTQAVRLLLCSPVLLIADPRTETRIPQPGCGFGDRETAFQGRSGSAFILPASK
jgi:hypothetical protein